jgi:hypothetical protein|tara:strand:- start:588 stop:845 length:258 start_codon:yes stop_codon:yes gene_type:complete
MYNYFSNQIVEIRGCEFSIDISYNFSEGGGHFDEPKWVDFEIGAIYNPKRNQPVSKRLAAEILKYYENSFIDEIADEHSSDSVRY